MEQINVVYLIGQLSCGGTERQLLLLIKHLNRDRFRPWVICLSNETSMISEFQEIDCPVIVFGRPRDGRIVTFLRVLKMLRKIRPAIVQSFGFASRLAVLVSRLAGCRINISSIRTDPMWNSVAGRLLDAISFRASDVVLANSRHAIRVAQARNMAGSTPFHLVYNGLNLEEFDHASDEPLSKPEVVDGSFSPKTRAICSVASLKDIKDIRTLVDAFAIVNAEVDDVELWIVGDGPQKTELIEHTIQGGFEEKVRFWGLRLDIPAILRRSAIGVNSSLVEGLSNAIVEYMAAGLPVVVTDVGGSPEAVLNDFNGILVSPRDPSAMATAILRLLKNPELAQRMGKRGRQRAEDVFSVDRMVSETQGTYQHFISNVGVRKPAELLSVTTDKSTI
jgi:glycosyltransferase involved in cell wall biosynthesis